MTALDPIPYPDAKLRRILSTVRTIAMVGASSNWNRPSYFVMKYLQGKGYRVIPVNPGTAGQDLLGERIYPNLRDIPDKIDMVVLVSSANGEVQRIVPKAIKCPTVEQFAAGVVQKAARGNIAGPPPTADSWFRTGMTLTWGP